MSAIRHRALLLAAQSPPPSQTLLSTSNKSSDIILSNGDQDAESNSTSGGGIVLSASGKSSGRYYFETEILQLYSTLPAMGFGLHRGSSGLSTFVGGDADGWGLWDQGTNNRTHTYFNNIATNDAAGGDAQVGVKWGCAVDLDNGRIWFRAKTRNSGAWIGGGNPTADTSPTYTFTPGGGTYYIALCPRRGATTPTTNRNKMRLVLPENWEIAAPGLYGRWT